MSDEVDNGKDKNAAKRRRHKFDRRSGEDRRKVYDADYFEKGGIERRKWKERRSKKERRSGWKRVSEWYSVYIDHVANPDEASEEDDKDSG